MRLIERTEDFETCFALRKAVFVDEQAVPIEEERDVYDDSAAHFLAWDGDNPVGTARVVIAGDTGKIGRVCVLASARGQGLGRDLIDVCLDHLKTLSGVKRAVLGAQVPAIGFYERFGFSAYGGEFDDAGIPHRMMEKPL